MLRIVTSMLDYSIIKKDPDDMRAPILNFMDTHSMETWMYLRRVTMTVGNKFLLRFNAYISIFLTVLVCSAIFSLLMLL